LEKELRTDGWEGSSTRTWRFLHILDLTAQAFTRLLYNKKTVQTEDPEEEQEIIFDSACRAASAEEIHYDQVDNECEDSRGFETDVDTIQLRLIRAALNKV
jgi:hypothetical protein